MNHLSRRTALCAAAIGALSLPRAVRAGVNPASAALLAAAPVAQFIFDISGSSPAFDQTLMDSIAPDIAARVLSLPVGSTVTVATVGDATAAASLLRMQIQARGTTASDVARKLRRFVHDFPAQMRGHEQGRSDLVGGFAAAAPYINRASDANVIVMVSDLVEYSTLADCSRARRCVLPARPSFDLSGARVVVYGVGQGLPSPQAMQLIEDWRALLSRAKAREIDLRRF